MSVYDLSFLPFLRNDNLEICMKIEDPTLRRGAAHLSKDVGDDWVQMIVQGRVASGSHACRGRFCMSGRKAEDKVASESGGLSREPSVSVPTRMIYR